MNFGDDGSAGAEAENSVSGGARMVPRVTIQAFCERAPTAELMEMALHDRRMSRAALTTHNGGIAGAIETYHENPTPNLIIIETTLEKDKMMSALDELAEVCDAGTRLIVLGHVNDVLLYRELIRFGVSEYLVLPVTPSVLVDAIAELFVAEGAEPIGRSIAFISAKGGAGSSTVAHNVAWSIAQDIRQDVLILDMDLGFGTAGLNFNQDPPHGLGDAVMANEKVDAVMLDRLMSKAASHINMLTAPCTLDKAYDFDERGFEQVIELCQQNVPVVVLDIPHAWNGWIRHTLTTADEIVIVAEPDLANLRNTKNITDMLKQLRPSELEPLLVLNRTGIPRRPEISATDFQASLDCRFAGQIAFDAGPFGTAANNGQMIPEVAQNHKSNELFRQLAREVTGRAHSPTHTRKGSFSLSSITKLLKQA